jgi:hypothetical protein
MTPPLLSIFTRTPLSFFLALLLAIITCLAFATEHSLFIFSFVHSLPNQAFAKIQKATKIVDIDRLVQTFVHAEDQNFQLFNCRSRVLSRFCALVLCCCVCTFVHRRH